MTLAIIACDEADRIGRAIQSAAFATEILVLDSGSTDGTVELARGLGAVVHQLDWPGHVIQKRRALKLASQPWVLSLDADEHLDPQAAEAVQRAVSQPGAHAGFSLRRRNHWLGHPVRGGGLGPDRRLRLLRRDQARVVGQDPHDLFLVDGAVAALPGTLEHHPYRNLGEHLSTIDRYSQRFAETALANGRRCGPMDLALRPPLHFVSTYLLRAGFRDGARGVAMAWLGTAYTALRWQRLWALQRERRP